MIKVILADDNKIILERFTKLIDWKKFGFEIVSTAIDGKNAWNDYICYHPELVITDIQMPKMTGIELAQKIHEASPNTIVLFLTSYEEFSYVKSAINLGVHNYLLKHETDKEKLLRILDDVKEIIKKRNIQDRYAAKAGLYTLTKEADSNQLNYESKINYQMNLPDNYDLLLIEQDHIYPVLSELLEVKANEINENRIRAITEENTLNLTAIIKLNDFQNLALIKSKGFATELAFDLKKALHENTNNTFSILIIAENSPILICAEQYAISKRIMDQKCFTPRSSIGYLNNLRPPDAVNGEVDFDRINYLIKNNEFNEIFYLMEKYFLEAIEARNDIKFSELTRYFVSVLYSYHGKIINLKAGLLFKLYDETTFNSLYDANSIYQWIKLKYLELSKTISNTAYPKYTYVVKQAIEYVNDHYDNSELSVESIADALKMNPNRLNTKFKKETGETIWKLIIKVRMDKARDLLNNSNKKVSEICLLTGYKSISYFSKVFKETYGMTPLEYRRKNDED